MKQLLTVTIFLTSIFAFADSKDIAGLLNDERTCSCNALPANLPVVGLFHTSHWGTSALKVFSINDSNPMNSCTQLLKQLQKTEICN